MNVREQLESFILGESEIKTLPEIKQLIARLFNSSVRETIMLYDALDSA